MKNFLTTALIVGALAIPSVGFAQEGVPLPDASIPGNTAGFDNRGQCQRAVTQARNEDRRNRDGLSNQDNNQQSRQNVRCEESEDGRFRAVFNN